MTTKTNLEGKISDPESKSTQINQANEDRRSRRTRQLLSRALIALSLEKGYDAVTIRDITNEADIGYATFFRHYRDKNELLEGVGEVVLEEIIDLLSTDKELSSIQKVGVVLFQYVQAHSEIVRMLMGSREIMQKIISEVSQRKMAFDQIKRNIQVPIEIIAYQNLTASISLIEWWIAHEMPYSAEQMGQYFGELII